MLPVGDTQGKLTGREMVRYCRVLIAVSLLPVVLGLTGPPYVAPALVLGGLFLRSCIGFARSPGVAEARRVLRASLIYLPSLLLLLVMNSIR